MVMRFAKPQLDSTSRVARGVWWLSPAGGILVITVPMLLLALALTDSQYRSAWGTPKYLDINAVALLSAGAGLFMLTSMLWLLAPRAPRSEIWPRVSAATRHDLGRAARILLGVTMFGYAAMFAAGFARGASATQLLKVLVTLNNSDGQIKELFAPIAGITTFTQMGIAYAVIAGLLMVRQPGSELLVGMFLVLGGAAFRGYFLTERLALLEVILPFMAVVLMAWSADKRKRIRMTIGLGPALLVPVLILVFGLFEYSRSWQFYRLRTGGGFFEFATERLAGYYVTAFNNGQIALLFERAAGRLPLDTLEFFWTAPGIQQANLYDRLSTVPASRFWDLLGQKGTEELNSPCGLCAPFIDWGTIGGLVWWAAAGLLLGWLYREFCNSRHLALLVYPPLVTGLYEMPRYVYWVKGRLFPTLVALIIIAVWLRRRQQAESADSGSVDLAEVR